MKKTEALLPLFRQFIKETETGKRLKKNGERIQKQSISNYKYVLHNLEQFAVLTPFELRICNTSKLTKRELTTETNYWKRFYKKFTAFLYKKGCRDNYVGANIKVIRVFLNYLKRDKNIQLGDITSLLYVRKETIDILVLSPEQLKYFIHDEHFNESLSPRLKRVKDIFVFGCTTGLRYSDIFKITNSNFEKQGPYWYLKIKSVKTKTYSYIKLPDYAVAIYKTYKTMSAKKPLFGALTLFNFNKNLKILGEKAGLTHPITQAREIQGKLKSKGDAVRFCDKMSSHMMRRTAITTLLILGMPEHLVRKISGHSNASTSFNRYVHYAQPYIDKEIDKVHDKLNLY